MALQDHDQPSQRPAAKGASRGSEIALDEVPLKDIRPLSLIANPEDKLLERELSEHIKEALDKLPELYREAVFLTYIEGLSYEEVATILNCPIGTVMSRLYRGRRMLREKLEIYRFALWGKEPKAKRR